MSRRRYILGVVALLGAITFQALFVLLLAYGGVRP